MKTVQLDFWALKTVGSFFSELHLIVKVEEEFGNILPIAPLGNDLLISFVEDYENITQHQKEISQHVDYEDVFNIEFDDNQLLVCLKPSKILAGWFLCYTQNI